MEGWIHENPELIGAVHSMSRAALDTHRWRAAANAATSFGTGLSRPPPPQANRALPVPSTGPGHGEDMPTAGGSAPPAPQAVLSALSAFTRKTEAVGRSSSRSVRFGGAGEVMTNDAVPDPPLQPAQATATGRSGSVRFGGSSMPRSSSQEAAGRQQHTISLLAMGTAAFQQPAGAALWGGSLPTSLSPVDPTASQRGPTTSLRDRADGLPRSHAEAQLQAEDLAHLVTRNLLLRMGPKLVVSGKLGAGGAAGRGIGIQASGPSARAGGQRKPVSSSQVQDFGVGSSRGGSVFGSGVEWAGDSRSRHRLVHCQTAPSETHQYVVGRARVAQVDGPQAVDATAATADGSAAGADAGRGRGWLAGLQDAELPQQQERQRGRDARLPQQQVRQRVSSGSVFIATEQDGARLGPTRGSSCMMGSIAGVAGLLSPPKPVPVLDLGVDLGLDLDPEPTLTTAGLQSSAGTMRRTCSALKTAVPPQGEGAIYASPTSSCPVLTARGLLESESLLLPSCSPAAASHASPSVPHLPFEAEVAKLFREGYARHAASSTAPLPSLLPNKPPRCPCPSPSSLDRINSRKCLWSSRGDRISTSSIQSTSHVTLSIEVPQDSMEEQQQWGATLSPSTPPSAHLGPTSVHQRHAGRVVSGLLPSPLGSAAPSRPISGNLGSGVSTPSPRRSWSRRGPAPGHSRHASLVNSEYVSASLSPLFCSPRTCPRVNALLCHSPTHAIFVLVTFAPSSGMSHEL